MDKDNNKEGCSYYLKAAIIISTVILLVFLYVIAVGGNSV